jgi:hypothetical protein
MREVSCGCVTNVGGEQRSSVARWHNPSSTLTVTTSGEGACRRQKAAVPVITGGSSRWCRWLILDLKSRGPQTWRKPISPLPPCAGIFSRRSRSNRPARHLNVNVASSVKTTHMSVHCQAAQAQCRPRKTVKQGGRTHQSEADRAIPEARRPAWRGRIPSRRGRSRRQSGRV